MCTNTFNGDHVNIHRCDGRAQWKEVVRRHVDNMMDVGAVLFLLCQVINTRGCLIQVDVEARRIPSLLRKTLKRH